MPPTLIEIPVEYQSYFPDTSILYDEKEVGFIVAVNNYRASLDPPMPALVASTELMLAAQLQSDYMLKTGNVTDGRDNEYVDDPMGSPADRASMMGYSNPVGIGSSFTKVPGDYDGAKILARFEANRDTGSMAAIDGDYKEFGISIAGDGPSYVTFTTGNPREGEEVVVKPEPVQSTTEEIWHPVTGGGLNCHDPVEGYFAFTVPGTFLNEDESKLKTPDGQIWTTGTYGDITAICTYLAKEAGATGTKPPPGGEVKPPPGGEVKPPPGGGTKPPPGGGTKPPPGGETKPPPGGETKPPPGCPDPTVEDAVSKLLPDLKPKCSTCQCPTEEMRVAADNLRLRAQMYLNKRGCVTYITPRYS